MSNFDSQFDQLKKLQFPTTEFMVVSSGALAVRGIRDSRDLDVIVTPALWETLSQKHPVVVEDGRESLQFESGIDLMNPAHSWYGNKCPIPTEELFAKADVFDGIKFINLEHLKVVKQTMGREKDLEDIKLIDTYVSAR